MHNRANQGNDTAPYGGQLPDANRPRIPWWALFLGLLLVNVLVVNLFFPGPEAPVEIPYTTFLEQVDAGNVEAIDTRADVMQGVLEEPMQITLPDGETVRELTRFTTTLPSFVDPGLETRLVEQGVEINAETLEQPRNPFLTLILSFLPTLVLIGLFVWMGRRMARNMSGQGGMFSMGQSKAKRYDETGEKVTFDDVAGIDEAENELFEIVDFLRAPERYTDRRSVV